MERVIQQKEMNEGVLMKENNQMRETVVGLGGKCRELEEFVRKDMNSQFTVEQQEAVYLVSSGKRELPEEVVHATSCTVEGQERVHLIGSLNEKLGIAIKENALLREKVVSLELGGISASKNYKELQEKYYKLEANAEWHQKGLKMLETERDLLSAALKQLKGETHEILIQTGLKSAYLSQETTDLNDSVKYLQSRILDSEYTIRELQSKIRSYTLGVEPQCSLHLLNRKPRALEVSSQPSVVISPLESALSSEPQAAVSIMSRSEKLSTVIINLYKTQLSSLKSSLSATAELLHCFTGSIQQSLSVVLSTLKAIPILFLSSQLAKYKNQATGYKNAMQRYKSLYPPYIPNRIDSLDESLALYINSRVLPLEISFTQISTGIYLFGTRKIQLKVEKDSLVVRVGGGYLSLDEFIDKCTPIELVKLTSKEMSSSEPLLSLPSKSTRKVRTLPKHLTNKVSMFEGKWFSLR